MRMLPRAGYGIGLGLLGIVLGLGCGGGDGGTTKTDSSHSEASGGKRIVILTNGNSPFWDAARKGMEKGEKDLKLEEAGFRAVMEVNDGSPQGQLDRLRQLASQPDIVAVAVSAVDANNAAIAEQMRKMKDKGIHIITVDSDVDRDKFREVRTAFIGTNNLMAGQELGKCAKNLLPGGEYVAFVGRTGAQNAIERINGFGEGAGPSFKKLDVMPDDTNRSQARENVRTAIRNNPGLNTLVGIWSYNAPAIVDVVKQLKIRDKVKIVAFDAEPGAIKAMGEGYLDAMVVQNPWQMGYSSVELMLAMSHNPAKASMKKLLPNLGQKEGDIVDTGTKVVVPESGSPLTKEMFDKSTEFMKLDAFKQWLADHNLTES